MVPTWNYEAIYVYGHIRWRHDAAWLLANVNALTERFESAQPKPWAVADAPEGYIDRLIGAIIGVEFQISRIEAKRKLSQNRSPADREGVISRLSDSASDEDSVLAMVLFGTIGSRGAHACSSKGLCGVGGVVLARERCRGFRLAFFSGRPHSSTAR